MDDMNLGEILKEVAEENQTRKILELLNESKDLEEAKAKVKSLLDKKGQRKRERAVDLPEAARSLISSIRGFHGKIKEET